MITKDPTVQTRPQAPSDTSPPAESAVIEGLQKSFVTRKREVHAVRGIDLRVTKGEYVVILGPSGCGKSTLMRCVAGLERPTGGRVALSGDTVYDEARGIDVRPDRRNVGMVFQDYALWPHMTVHKNVAYPLKMRKVDKGEREKRVTEVLAVLECTDLASRLPAELSGGQQQRIALARAMASRPGILLLDEPLSNLDALLRVTLRAELLRLHRELGFTALHITHDQEEALEMGDRIVLMREGQIEQVGPPEEVYAKPVSPYAATFFGVRNRLDVTVKNGRLEHAAGMVAGSERLVTRRAEGEHMEFFVRSRDTRMWATSSGDLPSAKPEVSVTGTLAQIVLGEGGRRQYIVDVAGEQWFAEHATKDKAPSPGDEVVVAVPLDSVLLYHDDEAVGVPTA